MNRINIDYSITKDYTGMNPPLFLPVIKIYNLILLPDNQLYNIKLNDSINILDITNNTPLPQKVVITTGYTIVQDQKYFYFYIANGIMVKNHKYALILNGNTIDLETTISSHSAKLLIGSLILEDNYSYMFDTNIPLLANINNNQVKFTINKIINKYNFYQALTNNTILLFDLNNIELLSQLNSTNDNIMIRPLYYDNFPLGSLSINISNYSGVSNNITPEFKIFVDNKSYYINDNRLNIINLASNTYTIKIIDRFGLLHIDNLNGQIFDQDQFTIFIPLVQDNYKLDRVALPIPRENKAPMLGLANLMINLDHDKSFELLGPNNFYKSYSSGYQSLYNIESGHYFAKYNDKLHSFYIAPNEITHIP